MVLLGTFVVHVYSKILKTALKKNTLPENLLIFTSAKYTLNQRRTSGISGRFRQICGSMMADYSSENFTTAVKPATT